MLWAMEDSVIIVIYCCFHIGLWYQGRIQFWGVLYDSPFRRLYVRRSCKCVSGFALLRLLYCVVFAGCVSDVQSVGGWFADTVDRCAVGRPYCVQMRLVVGGCMLGFGVLLVAVYLVFGDGLCDLVDARQFVLWLVSTCLVCLDFKLVAIACTFMCTFRLSFVVTIEGCLVGTKFGIWNYLQVWLGFYVAQPDSCLGFWLCLWVDDAVVSCKLQNVGKLDWGGGIVYGCVIFGADWSCVVAHIQLCVQSLLLFMLLIAGLVGYCCVNLCLMYSRLQWI
eukprot:gene2919-1901_t